MVGKTKQLHQGQIDVLLCVAKYRFVSVQQLGKQLGLRSKGSLLAKIAILENIGYLDRRYELTYKISGRPASFSITPSGLRYLRTTDQASYISDATIKSNYKDKTAALHTIDNYIELFAMAQQLQRLHTGMAVYTPRQLAVFDYFPKPLPDLYAVLKKVSKLRASF